MGRSLPTKFLSSSGESPVRSTPETGSRATAGSKWNNFAALSAPSSVSARAYLSSGTAFAGHGKSRHAIQAIFRAPGIGDESPKLKLDRYAGACQAHLVPRCKR